MSGTFRVTPESLGKFEEQYNQLEVLIEKYFPHPVDKVVGEDVDQLISLFNQFSSFCPGQEESKAMILNIRLLNALLIPTSLFTLGLWFLDQCLESDKEVEARKILSAMSCFIRNLDHGVGMIDAAQQHSLTHDQRSVSGALLNRAVIAWVKSTFDSEEPTHLYDFLCSFMYDIGGMLDPEGNSVDFKCLPLDLHAEGGLQQYVQSAHFLAVSDFLPKIKSLLPYADRLAAPIPNLLKLSGIADLSEGFKTRWAKLQTEAKEGFNHFVHTRRSEFTGEVTETSSKESRALSKTIQSHSEAVSDYAARIQTDLSKQRKDFHCQLKTKAAQRKARRHRKEEDAKGGFISPREAARKTEEILERKIEIYTKNNMAFLHDCDAIPTGSYHLISAMWISVRSFMQGASLLAGLVVNKVKKPIDINITEAMGELFNYSAFMLLPAIEDITKEYLRYDADTYEGAFYRTPLVFTYIYYLQYLASSQTKLDRRHFLIYYYALRKTRIGLPLNDVGYYALLSDDELRSFFLEEIISPDGVEYVFDQLRQFIAVGMGWLEEAPLISADTALYAKAVAQNAKAYSEQLKAGRKALAELENEAVAGESVTIRAHIERSGPISRVTVETSDDEDDSDGSDDGEEVKEPEVDFKKRCQRKVNACYSAFKQQNFNDALASLDDLENEITRLFSDDRLVAFCLILDARMQLTKAFISRLDRNPQAGEIAQFPRQKILYFYRDQLFEINPSPSHPKYEVLKLYLIDAQKLLNDYAAVISIQAKKQAKVDQDLSRQWDEARRTGVFKSWMRESHKGGASKEVQAKRSLIAAKVLDSSGSFVPDYQIPVVEAAKKPKRKGKKGRGRSAKVSAAKSLLSVCQAKLGIAPKAVPDSAELIARLEPRKVVRRSAAGAGAGAGSKRDQQKYEQAVEDKYSKSIHMALTKYAKDFPEESLSYMAVYGGFILDVIARRSFKDIDVRFQGSKSDFKRYFPDSSLGVRSGGVASAFAEYITPEAKWDFSISPHLLGVSHFAFSNGVFALYSGRCWVARTWDNKIVTETFLNQPLQRVSPMTLEQDPMLILRALNEETKGWVLSEDLKAELEQVVEKMCSGEVAYDTGRGVAYLGSHPKIFSDSITYKALSIGELFGQASVSASLATPVRSLLEYPESVVSVVPEV